MKTACFLDYTGHPMALQIHSITCTKQQDWCGYGNNRSKEQAIRDMFGRIIQFAKLQAGQSELDAIAGLYEKNEGHGPLKSLRGRGASKTSFSKSAPNHQWLHLIMHGYFVPAQQSPAPRSMDEKSNENLSAGSASQPPAEAGIGAGLVLHEGRCLVTSVISTGAAADDGRLKIGDEIVGVANPNAEAVAASGKTLIEIVKLIRGPVGTNVRLQVRPLANPDELAEITITRAQPSQSVATPPAVHPGLLSALAFAGVNDPPKPGNDDGLLTALEVQALNLSQVNVVVLSACETGLGEVAGGEGLLGLQRAFQIAGAKTVVASLWKVPDAATAKLMQRFYENLWNKKRGKLEALRDAQLFMLKYDPTNDPDSRGSLNDIDGIPSTIGAPYFWAAFVLSGDWR